MPSVVILAGGTATRLRPITETIAKSMVEVAGKPFIAHQMALLKSNGISDVVICSGHLSHQIESFVGDGSDFGLSVRYSNDGEKLLGTGGAVKKALNLLGEEFFVMYGDSYLTVDFKEVYKIFTTSQKTGVMTVLKNADAWDKSNIVYHQGKIIAYDKKNKLTGMNFIDYGLSMLKKEAFVSMNTREAFDLSEVLQNLISQNQMAGFEVKERFYEIGSLNGLTETEKYILMTKTGG